MWNVLIVKACVLPLINECISVISFTATLLAELYEAVGSSYWTALTLSYSKLSLLQGRADI